MKRNVFEFTGRETPFEGEDRLGMRDSDISILLLNTTMSFRLPFKPSADVGSLPPFSSLISLPLLHLASLYRLSLTGLRPCRPCFTCLCCYGGNGVARRPREKSHSQLLPRYPRRPS